MENNIDHEVTGEASEIIAYKGFDANWQCRGFQYEVGKTYDHEGEVHAATTGCHAVSAALGYGSKAKAGEKGAICLVHRDSDLSIVHIRASKVGENGIKPSTWYELNHIGDFVEANE